MGVDSSTPISISLSGGGQSYPDTPEGNAAAVDRAIADRLSFLLSSYPGAGGAHPLQEFVTVQIANGNFARMASANRSRIHSAQERRAQVRQQTAQQQPKPKPKPKPLQLKHRKGAPRPRVASAQCSICLEAVLPDAVAGNRAATMPCGHVHHEQCISRWAITQNSTGRSLTCPVCRHH